MTAPTTGEREPHKCSRCDVADSSVRWDGDFAYHNNPVGCFYALCKERDALRADLARVTAERDEVRRDLDLVRRGREALVEVAESYREKSETYAKQRDDARATLATAQREAAAIRDALTHEDITLWFTQGHPAFGIECTISIGDGFETLTHQPDPITALIETSKAARAKLTPAPEAGR